MEKSLYAYVFNSLNAARSIDHRVIMSSSHPTVPNLLVVVLSPMSYSYRFTLYVLNSDREFVQDCVLANWRHGIYNIHTMPGLERCNVCGGGEFDYASKTTARRTS